MSQSDLIIYGAGGFAREVAWLAESAPAEWGTLRCFVDDDPARAGTSLNGYEVLSLESAQARYAGAGVAVAVGSPGARRSVAARAEAAGFAPTTLVHPSCHRSRWVEIGDGTVVCAGTSLTTNIVLGRHVQINLHCTIGHDVVLADFVTLAPGVHVSGYVEIDAGAYLGTGACIINGASGSVLRIGADAVVGAGAVVTRDVAADTTVVGVPAKALRRETAVGGR
jgi:sugar O-acyltransferase (sialic acid O-acetyltransferase NeuD family)